MEKKSTERESSLERYLYRLVRLNGGYAVKLAPTVKGLPDRMIITPKGKIELVELKTERGSLSPAQQVFRDRMATVGRTVHVLRGRHEIDKWVAEYVTRDRMEK